MVKSDVDVFQTVGLNTAYVLSGSADASNGSIRIDLINRIDSSKLSGLEIIPLKGTHHTAHAVAAGPFSGTVIDGSGKAKVQLVGETSHSHGNGMALVSQQWKEGNTVLGNTLNLNYSFPVGTHTISLTVKDNGNNVNTQETTVLIKPLGSPAIEQLLPNSGSMVGGFNVILKGDGFTFSAAQTKVFFGQTMLTGADIEISNANTISFKCPKSDFAQPVSVTVQTPLGTSEDSEFVYLGLMPIQFVSNAILSIRAPTVGRFGPDQRLYVGTREGKIFKITMNSDFTSTVNVIAAQVNPVDIAM